jgi:hypothetical protein
MAQVICLGGHIVWPHDSGDANLPVKSVLGGQIGFERDKVGDTDLRFFSLCATVMFAVP